jgi:branched-chain amino acid transport system substrate-binding protein
MSRTKAGISRRRRVRVVAQAGALVAVAAVALAACGSSGTSAKAGATTSASSPTTAAAGGSSTAATKSPIIIGNIGNYSGFAADISKATYYGLQAWADDTNAKGGLLGHPIQVVVNDDASTPAKSVIEVKDMVENKHVVAIVGNHESGVDGAWASYVQGKNVPVVGGVATGLPYYTNPDFFPVTDTGLTGSIAYVGIAKLLGKTSSTVAYCAEVPACAQAGDLMKKYAAQIGIGYVPGQPVAATATSYTAQCAKFKQGGAQSVFLASDLTTAGRIIASCRANGYSPLFVDNPQNWKDSELTNPVWEGLGFGSDAPLWFGDGPGTADFLAAMKKYEPTAILNTSTTSGWYAGQVFGEAIKAANPSGDITSQTVLDGLYALGPNYNLNGTIPDVTYTKGKPATQALCAWYAVVKSGKLTTPFGTKPVCQSS